LGAVLARVPQRVSGGSRRWVVETIRDTPAAVHALEPSDVGQPTIWIIEPAAPALVLGSTQSPQDVDFHAAAALGFDVVTRRSGGGAVLVSPDNVVWLDVIIPRDDPRWVDDVGLATHWLGTIWAEVAAGMLGDARTVQVHRGPLIADQLAKTVCFVGRGPGEVTVDGRKLVGISQRRTRDWARFQCAYLLEWDWRPLLELFPGLNDADVDRLRYAAAGSGHTARRVIDRLVTSIIGL